METNDQLNSERTANLAIQVIPLSDDVFNIVDHSIQVIAESGLAYEVGPLETVMETSK